MAENLIVLSDEDADYPSTPISSRPKRLRATRAELGLDPAPTIFLMDDDPSPLKPTPSSSYAATVVPETPMSDVAAAGRCTVDLSAPEIRVLDFGSKTSGGANPNQMSSGVNSSQSILLEDEQEEKLQNADLRAETVELKKFEREKRKWEKGKLPLIAIVAQLDAKVLEQASVGGHLLSRFAEKGCWELTEEWAKYAQSESIE
ncbi:unnamed protein product [Linum tenue]|uniref:Uncharacterized protein n=1 Tax=Linum tenue TaxID=586396 RepID=A0AAV0L1Z2_9ROSI|nr:unnamed protein product [Linum tenue]